MAGINVTRTWSGLPWTGLASGAIALLWAGSVLAVPVPTNINVSADTGAVTKSEVSIDVNPTDPDNLVIISHSGDTDPLPPDLVTGATNDNSFNVMQTFFSTDGGSNWTSVTLGDNGVGDIDDGFVSAVRFDPSVAFDADGNVYIAYGVSLAAEAADDPATLDIDESVDRTAVVVAQSADGGATYGQITTVDTTADVGISGNDKWHLATGRDPGNANQQNVYIAWTQNTAAEQKIVVAGSTDGGMTFSAALKINDDTDSGQLFADPTVGLDGTLFVSWHDIETNKVHVDASTDAGATFGVDNLVTDIDPDFFSAAQAPALGFKVPVSGQPTRGVHVGPVLDADVSGAFPGDNGEGRIYEAYVDLVGDYTFDKNNFDNNVENTDIFVRHSDDGGVTWSDPVRVNDDDTEEAQFLPWIDVDPIKGFVGVVWYDARDDGLNLGFVDVFFSFSLDGGVTFEPNIKLNEVISEISGFANGYLEYIGLAGFDHVFNAVWALGDFTSKDLDIITTSFRVPEPPAPAWLAALVLAGMAFGARRRA